MTYLTTLILRLVVFSVCCQSDNSQPRPIEPDNLYSCYYAYHWKEDKLAESLLGKWKYIYLENAWHYGKGLNTENENLTLEFNSDSVLIIQKGREILHTTKWKIAKKDFQMYGLDLESPSPYLYGRILICSSILEFSNSHQLGNDHYFLRMH